jgi:hypothetical protein
VCVFVFIPSAQADERIEMYCSASVTTLKTLRERAENRKQSSAHHKTDEDSKTWMKHIH